VEGLKCPSNAPAVIAISTQKVRLVRIFFKTMVLSMCKVVKDNISVAGFRFPCPTFAV
jgi:hypothetical protein